uniref:Uncharacterized protein n=1 Tax=Ananas comosus var. bracteatus TaxID=296719 RepID=A0A6V7Q071_ANACO|nr:unnamed protein product [Ananas comosus var. bracteatus]
MDKELCKTFGCCFTPLCSAHFRPTTARAWPLLSTATWCTTTRSTAARCRMRARRTADRDGGLRAEQPCAPPPPQAQISFDRLSFSDVVQFADFGPRLSLNQSKASEDENFFLKFQVLGDKLLQEEVLPPPPPPPQPTAFEEDKEGGGEEGRLLENVSLSQQQLSFVGRAEKTGVGEVKNRGRGRDR